MGWEGEEEVECCGVRDFEEGGDEEEEEELYDYGGGGGSGAGGGGGGGEGECGVESEVGC